ncbi:MAG: hypothetical protein KKE20_03780 [Nanoarchaeota archaeon]|nr:hypothetical protein [Nanoarchaeota archaeon]
MAQLYIKNPTLSEIREATYHMRLEKQLENQGIHVPGLEVVKRTYNGAIDLSESYR